MIIDINAQLGQPWGSKVSQSADELLERMDRAGIDRAIVSTFPFGNYDNDYVRDAVRAHPDRLSGAVMMSPFAEEPIAETAARYLDDEGFVAVRMHPAAGGYKLSEHAVVGGILREALSRAVPVIVYTGDEPYATPFQVMIAAQKYPELNFIMLHSGFMVQTNDAVMVAEACPNVYLEHSSGISLGITQSIEAVGAERVLFGSDSPYMDLEVERYKFEITVPNPADLELIFHTNPVRLFRL